MDERIVLSVEDNKADFYAVKMALKEAQLAIRICRVADGEQAVWFLERTGKYLGAPRPHLVLLNINLPRKNGLEVLEYIKSNDSIRSIPVVMFTTTTNPGELNQALQLGAAEFITKGSDLDQLIEDLSGVCARFLAASP